MRDAVEVSLLEGQVRAVEGRTGAQVVVAVLERADVYHGLRWRAFALCAAFAGALVVLGEGARPGMLPPPAHFWAVAAILGAGLLAGIAVTLSPAAARLFLEPLRARAEARERAATFFLERGLFATRERSAVLLLACEFERQAAVHADSGFRGRVTPGEWLAIEEEMTALLRAGRTAAALAAGLAALERLLLAKGFTGASVLANELPDTPVTGPSAR